MSIQSEINNDPIFSDIMEKELDYDLIHHQSSIKFAVIKIALGRSLNKIIMAI